MPLVKIKVRSNSNPDKQYEVEYDDELKVARSCECPAGLMGKECVHMRRVQNHFANAGQKKINTYLIKVSQSAIPSDGKHELGDDVVVQVRGSVIEIKDTDNHDGSYDRTYKVKGVLAEIIKE